MAPSRRAVLTTDQSTTGNNIHMRARCAIMRVPAGIAVLDGSRFRPQLSPLPYRLLMRYPTFTRKAVYPIHAECKIRHPFGLMAREVLQTGSSPPLVGQPPSLLPQFRQRS